MDNSFLKSLSPQQYSTYLTNTIYSFPDFATNISQGHAKNIHIESNDVDLIKRASFEDVTWASSFQNNESFDDYVKSKDSRRKTFLYNPLYKGVIFLQRIGKTN